jgi:hypothetical protein
VQRRIDPAAQRRCSLIQPEVRARQLLRLLRPPRRTGKEVQLDATVALLDRRTDKAVRLSVDARGQEDAQQNSRDTRSIVQRLQNHSSWAGSK